MKISTIKITDKFNADKIHVFKISSSNVIKYNQEISGYEFYEKDTVVDLENFGYKEYAREAVLRKQWGLGE